MVDTLAGIILLGILSLAAFYDLWQKRIPNLLTLPAALIGLIYYGISSGPRGVLFSFEGLLLGMALLSVPYLMGGMGAGDVKLMGAVGGILGPGGVFQAFLFTSIVGGVYALLVVVANPDYRNRYKLILTRLIMEKRFSYIRPSEKEQNIKLRYGIAIAAGTLCFILCDRYQLTPKFVLW